MDWLFRNRDTGEFTIGQRPNAPLIVFLVALLARWIVSPEGTTQTVLTVIGTVALVVWAGDELVRGVNPWRRILGATVLTATIVGRAFG